MHYRFFHFQTRYTETSADLEFGNGIEFGKTLEWKWSLEFRKYLEMELGFGIECKLLLYAFVSRLGDYGSECER